MTADAQTSHDLAFAIAIVMQEDDCQADIAAGTVQARATEGGVSLLEVAATIVAVGYDNRDARRAREAVVRGAPFTHAEELLVMEQALIIVMRENACDADEAAEHIRAGATGGLGIVDVAQAIVEFGAGSLECAVRRHTPSA